MSREIYGKDFGRISHVRVSWNWMHVGRNHGCIRILPRPTIELQTPLFGLEIYYFHFGQAYLWDSKLLRKMLQAKKMRPTLHSPEISRDSSSREQHIDPLRPTLSSSDPLLSLSFSPFEERKDLSHDPADKRSTRHNSYFLDLFMTHLYRWWRP